MTMPRRDTPRRDTPRRATTSRGMNPLGTGREALGARAAPLSRRRFLQAAAAGATLPLIASCGSAPVASDAPNVLLVMSDAHRANVLGCYGDTQVRTPHFDAFAAQGARFELALSNTPMCRPYRASLMTGCFAHHTGMVTNRSDLNPGVDANGQWTPGGLPTLGAAFADAGYACGYVGKWHLGSASVDPGPLRFGFNDSWSAATSPTHTYDSWVYATGADHLVEGSGRFRPAMEVDLLLDFARAPREQPFFGVLSWGPPHAPFEPPADFRRDEFVQPPPNIERTAEYPLESVLQALTGYYGLVEAIDHEFGRLLKALDEAGLARNTIVIYTSDHGAQLGSHGVMGKVRPLRESLEVPFLVRWPEGIAPGTLIDTPFGAPDVFPTLAGLAGLPAPRGIDGDDFSPSLRGTSGAPTREAAYVASHIPIYMERPGWRGLRTRTHSFVRTKEGPSTLFEVASDPYELNNLVHARPELVAQLDAQFESLMQTHGDAWRVPKR
ncbi:MAG: sulfatase/phosphatase [Planctomycetota bacterium]|nr:MAG: sulfatase/phosphatase [Planctomycetota bacterium]